MDKQAISQEMRAYYVSVVRTPAHLVTREHREAALRALSSDCSGEKQFAVLRKNDGSTTIVADYGDYTYGPVYEVLEYLPTHREAREFVKMYRAGCADQARCGCN